MSAEISYPLTYRQQETRQVFRCLESGESCCLVASSGVGALNFLRFLLRPDVQQQYLNLEQHEYYFALVDLNALAEFSEWAVYELLLHTLLAEMRKMSLEASVIERSEDFYRQVVLSKDRLLGQRYFERTVQAICQRAELRLVFLFERFDHIFDRLDSLFFLGLRALRDTFKYRLCFVVSGLTDLARVRENLAEVEEFYMLLSRNVYGLEPYNQDDARTMVLDLAGRLGATLAEAEISWLIETCGGHARLMKTIFWTRYERPMPSQEAEIGQLLDDPGVWAECSRLWNGLDEDEQEAMHVMAAQSAPSDWLAESTPTSPSDEAMRLLRLKGLLKPDRTGMQGVFCPLFRDFVRRRGLTQEPGISLNPEAGDVWVEGRHVTNLTRLEYELLDYLARHRDCICTRGELVSYLYPGEYKDIEGHMVDEPRVDTLITRLRAKIEPDRTHPRFLITVRGRGYKLVSP